MGKIVTLLKLRFYEIAVFFGILFYFFYTEGYGCKIFTRFDFDSQAFLFWQFAAIKHYVPFKDIFYPYGILYFYKDTNFFLQLLFYAIPAILCSLIFSIFKKISNSAVLGFIFVAIFIAFIQQFIGLESIGRYAVSVIYAVILGIYFSRQKHSFFSIFFLGITSGFIFFLLNDQSIYAGILFVFLVSLHALIYKNASSVKKVLFIIIPKISIFFFGYIVGLVPFVIYLIFHHSFSVFIQMFLRNSDIALLAKTPFPPYAASAENIFTFLILFVTLGYLLSKKFIYKKEYTFHNFLQMSLCILLILLEQKSIIRSIDSQITFLAVLLYFFFFADVFTLYKKKQVDIFSLATFSMLVFSFITLISQFRIFHQSYRVANSFNENYCVAENKNLFMYSNKEYEEVVTYISKNSVTPHIFSYPGDPIFYLLFTNSLPYYPSSYEASPEYAQKNEIAFMRNEKIEYIIFNMAILSIQDGVPDYIRTPEIQKYILTHFTPIKVIGKFLILKKSNINDIFMQKKGSIPDTFLKFLLKVNVGAIPKSESIYKSRFINSSTIMVRGTAADTNNYLSKNNITSQDLFIFIKFQNKTDIQMQLSSTQALSTTVSMKDCSQGCILDVGRLPLFYISRRIEKIDFNTNTNSSISLFKSANSIFW